MKRRVLFFAHVARPELLTVTSFYQTDIRILEELGCEVVLTNSSAAFARFWTYDFAFIWFWTMGVFPAFVSKAVGKKVVFTGGIDNLVEDVSPSPFRRWVDRTLFRLCNVVADGNIMLSSADITTLRRMGIEIRHRALVPCVIDVEKYQYDGRVKKDLITTVVWMGTGEGNTIKKGADRLLNVYAHLLRRNANLSLTIIGETGPGSEYLKRLAAGLDVAEQVTFTGMISEERKIEYLRDSKFYFQLSRYEGFGIAAIEALAAGNIVVHSGKGALAETLGNTFGKMVDDPEDYAAIAALVQDLNRDYAQQGAWIARGIEHARNTYSYETRKRGLKQALDSILLEGR
jgi:glycosyltransferase involved in cell wall biosynthesis